MILGTCKIAKLKDKWNTEKGIQQDNSIFPRGEPLQLFCGGHSVGASGGLQWWSSPILLTKAAGRCVHLWSAHTCKWEPPKQTWRGGCPHILNATSCNQVFWGFFLFSLPRFKTPRENHCGLSGSLRWWYGCTTSNDAPNENLKWQRLMGGEGSAVCGAAALKREERKCGVERGLVGAYFMPEAHWGNFQM